MFVSVIPMLISLTVRVCGAKVRGLQRRAQKIDGTMSSVYVGDGEVAVLRVRKRLISQGTGRTIKL